MTKASALPGGGSAETLETGPFTDRFFAAMDDNLNTPAAIGVLTALTEEIERAPGDVDAARQALREFGAVLGLHLGEGASTGRGKR
jgi:hypothetical protein